MFLSPSLSLSLLSIYLSIYLSICLSIYVYLGFNRRISVQRVGVICPLSGAGALLMHIHTPISMYLSIYLCIYASIYVCMYVCLYVCIFLGLTIRVPVQRPRVFRALSGAGEPPG